MFSGPGISVFFQPIRAAGSEAMPPQAVAPLHKAGDEERGQQGFHENTENPAAPPAAEKDDGDFAFTEDHTRLSIQALRGLLGGEQVVDASAAALERVTAVSAVQESETPSALRDAAAAYRHAAAAKPPAALPAAAGFTPPPRAQATANDILLMLAQIEAAGISSVAVRDGASIYDTLAALCWSLHR